MPCGGGCSSSSHSSSKGEEHNSEGKTGRVNARRDDTAPPKQNCARSDPLNTARHSTGCVPFASLTPPAYGGRMCGGGPAQHTSHSITASQGHGSGRQLTGWQVRDAPQLLLDTLLLLLACAAVAEDMQLSACQPHPLPCPRAHLPWVGQACPQVAPSSADLQQQHTHQQLSSCEHSQRQGPLNS